MKEIKNLPIPDDPDTRSILKNFLTLVDKCEDIVMLSDGTNIEIEYVCDAKWRGRITLLAK